MTFIFKCRVCQTELSQQNNWKLKQKKIKRNETVGTPHTGDGTRKWSKSTETLKKKLEDGLMTGNNIERRFRLL